MAKQKIKEPGGLKKKKDNTKLEATTEASGVTSSKDWGKKIIKPRIASPDSEENDQGDKKKKMTK